MRRRLTARQAIAAVGEDFVEAVAPPGAEIPADGPLSWSGYADSRARATDRTGEEESVVHGLATVGGHLCVLISFEFGFLGGSLGQRAWRRRTTRTPPGTATFPSSPRSSRRPS
ncbi:hypothetical protein [Streptomyces sp. NPDC059460]|uniref:hypothetical protein n=1 Tax=Streptomyces sp. NPDC059460 TaxID=3346840 RepID=UPI0036D087E7